MLSHVHCDRGSAVAVGVASCSYRTVPSQCFRAGRRPHAHPKVRSMRDDDPEVNAVPDSLPVAAPGADWRAFRARLIAANKAEASSSAFAPTPTSTAAPSPRPLSDDLPDHWAHELPWPEKGCVLVAHPSLFVDRQTYFQQAVVLLLDHGPQGSYGVILNKPTQYTMGQMRSSVTQLLSSFSSNRLYMGGDVGDTAMAVVTRRGDIVGASEVTQGLYHHTVHAAQQAVEAGIAAPSDFRFFAQYAGWAPGQLAKECGAGVWFCAAASPSLVMDEELSRGKELWHRVLEIMGGDHGRVSHIVREVERRDLERRPQQATSATTTSPGNSSGAAAVTPTTTTTTTSCSSASGGDAVQQQQQTQGGCSSPPSGSGSSSSSGGPGALGDEGGVSSA